MKNNNENSFQKHTSFLYKNTGPYHSNVIFSNDDNSFFYNNNNNNNKNKIKDFDNMLDYSSIPTNKKIKNNSLNKTHKLSHKVLSESIDNYKSKSIYNNFYNVSQPNLKGNFITNSKIKKNKMRIIFQKKNNNKDNINNNNNMSYILKKESINKLKNIINNLKLSSEYNNMNDRESNSKIKKRNI